MNPLTHMLVLPSLFWLCACADTTHRDEAHFSQSSATSALHILIVSEYSNEAENMETALTKYFQPLGIAASIGKVTVDLRSLQPDAADPMAAAVGDMVAPAVEGISSGSYRYVIMGDLKGAWRVVAQAAVTARIPKRNIAVHTGSVENQRNAIANGHVGVLRHGQDSENVVIDHLFKQNTVLIVDDDHPVYVEIVVALQIQTHLRQNYGWTEVVIVTPTVEHLKECEAKVAKREVQTDAHCLANVVTSIAKDLLHRQRFAHVIVDGLMGNWSDIVDSAKQQSSNILVYSTDTATVKRARERVKAEIKPNRTLTPEDIEKMLASLFGTSSQDC